MDIAHLILLALHGLGLLGIIVGVIMQIGAMRRGQARVSMLLLVASATMVFSGLGLAGVIIATGTPNWPKLVIKLVIALAIYGGMMAHRNKVIKPIVLIGMLILTLVNVAIAVIW